MDSPKTHTFWSYVYRQRKFPIHLLIWFPMFKSVKGRDLGVRRVGILYVHPTDMENHNTTG